MKSGKREALRLSTLVFVFVTAAILWCCESNVNKVGGRDSDTDQPDPSTRFDEINGVVWFYNNRYDYRFEDIRGDLDTLHSAGFRILGFYAPYDGDKEKWHGCGPLDFYTPPPPCGSVEDFRALTSDAHDRGMKVVAYFAIIYIDKASEFFRTAEEQYAAGDRTSREVAAFHWTDNSEDPLPTPAAGPSAWQWSATAGAYFWSLWGEAGFDMNLAGARAEIERAEKFWLDAGLDGFMFDALFVDPAYRDLAVTLPSTYTPTEKWLTFESTNYEETDDYLEFGLTSWFNLEDDDTANDYTWIALGMDGGEGLEEALLRRDEARARGRLTHAWSIWEDEDVDPYPDEDRMRVQEAAALAGGGITYGAPDYEAYMRWPQARRDRWEAVLVAVNAHRSLWPSASRRRLSVGNDDRAYAMLRTSTDGTESALLVYNFDDAPRTVTVDLSGSSISTDQAPVDLYEPGATPPPIEGASYALELPAYGFTFLGVTLSP